MMINDYKIVKEYIGVYDSHTHIRGSEQKVLIFIDACYAGAMTKNIKNNETIVAPATRKSPSGKKDPYSLDPSWI